MPTDQIEISRDCFTITQRRVIAAVEFAHLFESKVSEPKVRPDIEWRLIRVGDEQTRFGRICHHEREPLPGRLDRSQVMPGAKQPENLASEIASEKSINLIQAPDDRGRNIGQRLTAQIELEVTARTYAGIPNLIGGDVQIELVSHQFGEHQ